MSAPRPDCRRRIGPTLRLVLLLLATSSPLLAEEYNPYKVPKEEFQREVAVIALQHVQVPPHVAQRDEVATRFEGLVRAELESKGYRIVEPAAVERQWVAMSQRVGGVFDPVTGEADEAKLKAVREYTGRELQRTHDVDAFVYVRISYEDMAPWGGGFNPWKAGNEALTWKGETLFQMPQRVIGAFLSVLVFDLAATPLYSIRAPIQWTRVYISRSYDDRPSEQLFVSQAANQKAVDVTLGPLVSVSSAATAAGD